MTLILPRRRFLAGLIGLVAAPAVVKASSLMKIAAPLAKQNLLLPGRFTFALSNTYELFIGAEPIGFMYRCENIKFAYALNPAIDRVVHHPSMH